MKKLLVLINVIVTFVSCNNKLGWGSDYKNLEPKDKTDVCISENNTMSISIASIYRVEYYNHSYIMFITGGDIFVIHDPDCKCLMK